MYTAFIPHSSPANVYLSFSPLFPTPHPEKISFIKLCLEAFYKKFYLYLGFPTLKQQRDEQLFSQARKHPEHHS